MEQNKEKTLPKGHYDSFVAQLSKDMRKSLKKKALKRYINL